MQKIEPWKTNKTSIRRKISELPLWQKVSAVILTLSALLAAAYYALDIYDRTQVPHIAVSESGFLNPRPCHSQGVYSTDDLRPPKTTDENISEDSLGLYGMGADYLTVTADGDSSYTVHDIRIENIEEINNDHIDYHIDASLSGCGSAGDIGVTARFNLDDPKNSREFTISTPGNAPQTGKEMYAYSVTSDASLMAKVFVESCKNSYSFNITLDYSTAGSERIESKTFGPYNIYKMDNSKPLIYSPDTKTLEKGQWGQDNSLCK